MSLTNVRRWLIAAGALILSTAATAQNAVRISEFHYDNTGADTGEAVEVSAPAGMDLTGWRVVLYNGAGGASYGTLALTGAVPATCGARGVVLLAAVGMQNGAPDGLALVDASDAVVEFLSYEGTFLATNGAANGLMSTDVGVSEAGNEPAGLSLARNVAGVWSGPATASFGGCNDDGEPPPVQEVASVSVAPPSGSINVGGALTFAASAVDAGGQSVSGVTFSWTSSNPAVASVSANGVVTGIAEGDTTIAATAPNGVTGTAALHVNAALPPPPFPDIRISELHYDNVGTDVGEAIEIEGPTGASLTNYSIVLYDGTGGLSYNTQALNGSLSTNCGTSRGVFVVNYPVNGIQNGSPDGIALIDSAGQVVEFLSYEGTFTPVDGPAAGLASTDIGNVENSPAVGNSLQRDSNNLWSLGASTFGACNGDGGPPPPPGNTLQFSGRIPTDPPLPVGYEDQLFATERDSNNVVIVTTFTWASDTPAIASIEPNGVVRALTEGTAVFRATAADGTTATYSLPTRVAVASGVTYPGNAEFGEPTDADPSDDFIVRHEQFTASYNANRGTPNWVSYELDVTHFGPEDRCDCFTMDADLPASFPRISTDDYTGAGTFAGYGIDRGHMTRSFDRTSGSLDNARTYLFSNVVPQAADLNQGPWAILENDLGDFARFQDREVYIITGVAGNKGTLKDLGRVVIPTSTWKVAVIVPHDTGLASIVDYRNLQVIAVNMPNDPGVRNVPWQTYLTTVDAIEALSGYDLLALLPDDVEAAVESSTQPPIGAIDGPAGAIAEGGSLTLSAAGSIDPNGTVVSYAWDFGDGATGSGVSVTHTYAQDGAFTARLTVTDNDGLSDTATFAVSVTNVAPVVGTVPDATVNVGAAYTAAGAFTDPGADVWTATVDWGDGSAPSSAAVTAGSFSLTHTYATAGLYTVAVSIADDDATTTVLHAVTVTQPAPGLAAALPLIDQLVATGKIGRAAGAVLKAEVVAAQRLVDRGNNRAAVVVLRTMVAEIDILLRLRVVSAADVAPLRALLVQQILLLGG